VNEENESSRRTERHGGGGRVSRTLTRPHAWLVGACLAVPMLVSAQAPAPSAHVLGVAESVLNYCEPLDPAASAKMRSFIEQLVQGVSPKDLDAVRESDEYKKAFDSMNEFVGKVDPRNAKRVCSESAAELK
jgi:hypothetical protein